MRKTIVVNLFSGPGAGKSTSATGIFHHLKLNHINSEYVSEYAKDVVWGENYKTLDNQIYVYGKQHNRIFRLKGKVDVIVTDSPAIMGMTYCDWDKVSPALQKLAYEEHHRDDIINMNYFIVRNKPYLPVGREQNEEQAREKDTEILNLLKENDIEFEKVLGCESSVHKIVADVLKKLEKNS